MDVEEESVGLPGTLPLPWVGGSWALLGAFGWARTGRVAMVVESGRPWLERKRRIDAGCGGETDPLFLPG